MLNNPRFEATIRNTYGPKGESWLVKMPEVLKGLKQSWQLELLPSFPNLSFNYVLPVIRSDGTQAVLKMGVPNTELVNEIEALKVYDGRGAVRLLESDTEKGALLIERLQPGEMLSTIRDEERATRIAADVLKNLWRPEPKNHHFNSLSDLAEGFDKISSLFPQGIPIPLRLIDQAKSLFADLISAQTTKNLLHGDFHHYNILSAGVDWKVIDPKGIIGEPEYDLAPFLENEINCKDPETIRKLTEKRINIFCEMLGFDTKRVKGWLVAHAILSTWWMVEDHEAESEKIKFSLASIEVFQKLRF